MNERPLVSIITVNFNQTDVTCAMLDSVRRQHYPSVETIVVDNGSAENPARRISADYPEVRFIRSAQNLGFAGGNNLGVKISRGEYLFFVNNDTELTPDCIDRLIDFAQSRPDMGAVSPLICYFSQPGQTIDTIQYAGMTRVSDITARNKTVGALQADRGQFAHPILTHYTHGAAMLVPRRVIDTVGSWPTDFFLYYEELDWCERIRRAGWSLWVEPRARIYHKESLTVSRMGPVKTYFMHRNRILFMRRNRPDQLLKFHLYYWGVILPKSSALLLLRGEWHNFIALWQATVYAYWGVVNPFERLVV